ncbi:MAG: DUF3147 family protein [Actinomycetota bacterium]|nr:DUF3147 family protein [Actinomycetota bacterium]
MPASTAAGTAARRAAEADVRPAVGMSGLRGIKGRDYLIRFGLGAVISIGAAIVGKVVGARFGGMFLAFPAILPASLTLIQDKEGTRTADRDAVGAVLGGLALIVFAAVGEATFVHLEPFMALGLALVGWVLVACALYGLLAFLQPEACDRRKD